MKTAYIFLIISKAGALEGAEIFSVRDPEAHAKDMATKIGGRFGEVLRGVIRP
jgi:hypothetical protein